MNGDGSTMRQAWPPLAAFWTVGVALLVGSLYGSAGPDRFRDAPACSPGQAFTSAYCRIAVEATVTAVTREQIVMDAGGRRVVAEMKFHGPLPDVEAGRPVRVTMYRGVAVHVEGGDLNLGTLGAPTDGGGELRIAGLLFLIGGTALVAVRSLSRPAAR